jgi:hypothetical protein
MPLYGTLRSALLRYAFRITARRLRRQLCSRSLRSRPHNWRLELTLASALTRLRCAQLNRRAVGRLTSNTKMD